MDSAERREKLFNELIKEAVKQQEIVTRILNEMHLRHIEKDNKEDVNETKEA